MNFRMMGRIIAMILTVTAILMVPAMIISFAAGESKAVSAFVFSILITLAAAGLLFLIGRKASKGFFAKEGMVCVGLCWVAMSIFGCLPFWLSGEIPFYIDALFEIVSGFTTTGASILSDVESLPDGILYWRSFSHWIGGMGVLVFMLAVVPLSGRNDGFTMHLLRAESPGPNVAKLVPRIRQTAAILYILYVVLTIVTIILLLAGGIPVLEAVCIGFGTAGTGGFGIKNDSMASYSPYIQNVCTIFMFLFGVNFSCYYLLIMRQFKSVYKDEELRFYIAIVLLSIVAIVINLGDYYPTLEETVRHAAFQVSTIITTTGYATTDFELWPGLSKAILLCLMIVGACAGSTGGGLKCGRALIIIKSLRRNIRKLMHPQRIQAVRMNDQVLDETVIENTNAYLAAYTIIIVISFIIVSADNFSIGTNVSAVLSCFNNIGPGFEAVGPTCNFGGYSPLSKIVLIVDMLAGRLEIFPILILFARYTWKDSIRRNVWRTKNSQQ